MYEDSDSTCGEPYRSTGTALSVRCNGMSGTGPGSTAGSAASDHGVASGSAGPLQGTQPQRSIDQ